jgi:hypothetical protein
MEEQATFGTFEYELLSYLEKVQSQFPALHWVAVFDTGGDGPASGANGWALQSWSRSWPITSAHNDVV